jgi:hypothetical protein
MKLSLLMLTAFQLVIASIMFSQVYEPNMVVFAAQRQIPRGDTQDAIDAIQEEQIRRLREDNTRTAVEINRTNEALADLTAAMNRFTGIGIGIGAVLTLLQIAQLQEMRKGNR